MKIKNMILTAVCICFLCLFGSVQVYATEYYGNFQYEDNGENVSIYAYNGSDKEVTIPAYINDKAVTEINDYAFLLCNSVEKIIVRQFMQMHFPVPEISRVWYLLPQIPKSRIPMKIQTRKIPMKTESRIRPMPQTIRRAIIQEIKMPETRIRPAYPIIRLRNSPEPTIIRAIIKLR